MHQFSPDSAYAHEVEGIATDAGKFLAKRAHQHHNQGHFSGKPAIVFDIDDTTLNTFSYEIYSSYVFNGTTNANFVNAGSASVFPAVPGMLDLEAKAEAKGYTVFFLTGRPESQRAPTEANLTDAGFDCERRQRLPQGQHQPVAGELHTHLHPGAVQVADPSAHRVARLRHRGQPR